MTDGILIVDKTTGLTSHDVVAMVRKALHTKKVGHTGTLDPMATGVLVICVGQATKLVNFLTCDSKKYEVKMKFGIKTDTGDITGNILKEEKEVQLEFNHVLEVIHSFLGNQKQIPPMYSAIKVNGKKLYELARQGIEIEREARDIEIFDISDIELTGENDETYLKFTVFCSKGTYVRSLCEDIATKLGTCGTMTKLRRIASGNFLIEDAIFVEDISEEKIIPIEKLFDKKIDVTKYAKRLINGQKIETSMEDGYYRLYTDTFIGIGSVSNHFLKREIILEKNDDEKI